MLLLFLLLFVYFNVEPLRVSMFVNKETTYLLTYCEINVFSIYELSTTQGGI